MALSQPEASGIIRTAAGEECQVDYGTGPMVRDPQSGKYRRTRLFVMTLGYSRKSVSFLVFRSSTRTWAELHEKAFRRLGGSCRIVVLDNLREGVLAPDLYDPTLNPLFKDVLAHYGVTAFPCKVRDPDRKGKVESGVGHAQKTPLKGKKFESLEDAQAYLDHWEPPPGTIFGPEVSDTVHSFFIIGFFSSLLFTTLQPSAIPTPLSNTPPTNNFTKYSSKEYLGFLPKCPLITITRQKSWWNKVSLCRRLMC